MGDPVEHPDHYTWIPGHECVDIAKHFSYCLGAALKYIWRAGRKDPSRAVEDLRKAQQYIGHEIARLEELGALEPELILRDENMA